MRFHRASKASVSLVAGGALAALGAAHGQTPLAHDGGEVETILHLPGRGARALGDLDGL